MSDQHNGDKTSAEAVLSSFDEPTAVQAITSAETDIQVSTAKRYPRSLETFKKRALSLATIDEEVAASCFYVLPRGGKNIEGPGVRLAEIVASSWGNLRCEARIIEENDRFLVARGTAWDMETNVLVATEIRRRITDKYNKKFSDDMIGVTANAACSIVLRNAIFRVVPRSLVDVIYEQAKKVAVGDAASLSTKREKVVARLVQMGAVVERVFAVMGRASMDEIDLADVEKLIGIGTAIKDGVTTVDQAFPPPAVATEVTTKVADMAAKAKKSSNSSTTEVDASALRTEIVAIIHNRAQPGEDELATAAKLCREATQGAAAKLDDLKPSELELVKTMLEKVAA